MVSTEAGIARIRLAGVERTPCTIAATSRRPKRWSKTTPAWPTWPNGRAENGTLKTYAGFPHGMPATEAETINADLLEFFRS